MGFPLWESVDEDDDIESEAELAGYSNFEADDTPEDLTEAMSDYGVAGSDSEEGDEPEESSTSSPQTQEIPEASVSVTNSSKQLWSDATDSDTEGAEYVSKEVQITKKTNAVEYPFLYMHLGSQCAVEVNLIKAMLRQGVQDSDDPYYHVYLNINGQVVRPEGVICCRELKTLLTTSIFKDVEKHIKLDADTTLKDDMMFALCMIDTF